MSYKLNAIIQKNLLNLPFLCFASYNFSIAKTRSKSKKINFNSTNRKYWQI